MTRRVNRWYFPEECMQDLKAMHNCDLPSDCGHHAVDSRSKEVKMIKVELRVDIRAWDTDEEEKQGAFPGQHFGTQIVFSEESIKEMRKHHNLDGVKELVRIWWRDLEKVLPGKLEDTARKALGM